MNIPNSSTLTASSSFQGELSAKEDACATLSAPEVACQVLMVMPRSFRCNEETRDTNTFQSSLPANANVQELALREFLSLQSLLQNHGIEVCMHQESKEADAPDSLFPNNWFARLPTGETFLFPMMAENRRREVHPEWIPQSQSQSQKFYDLRHFEEQNIYLEGTGSVILDHRLKTAYACLSPRTHVSALKEFTELAKYKAFPFRATDRKGVEYYHTNVIMALGERTAILCTEAIEDSAERQALVSQLLGTNRELLEISRLQVEEFAGNLIQLQNKKGERFWICSERAFSCLSAEQLRVLANDGQVLHVPLSTIETFGGGGARCMIAELW